MRRRTIVYAIVGVLILSAGAARAQGLFPDTITPQEQRRWMEEQRQWQQEQRRVQQEQQWEEQQWRLRQEQQWRQEDWNCRLREGGWYQPQSCGWVQVFGQTVWQCR